VSAYMGLLLETVLYRDVFILNSKATGGADEV